MQGRPWGTVLGAAAGMGTGYGLLMLTSGLFIEPMQESFGWSRTALTFVPMISVVSAAMLPVTGWAIDRWGARPIGLAGLAALSLGYIGLIFLPPNRALYYLIVLFIGVVAAASGPMPWTRGVVAWFDGRRGTALGLTLCGTSIITALCMPLISRVIEDYSWRGGYLVLLVLGSMLGVPLVYSLFRERPRRVGSAPAAATDPSLRAAVADRRFWVLLFCFSVVSIPVGGFMMHLVPLLVSRGMQAADAALVASSYALSIAGGRIAAGLSLDRAWPPMVAAICFLAPIVGTQLLGLVGAGTGVVVAVAAAVLLGLAQGAEADFIAFFAARYFPLALYARVYGVLAMVAYLAMAAGGLGFARLYDHDGHYARAIWIAALCYAAGGLVMLTIDRVARNRAVSARRFPT